MEYYIEEVISLYGLYLRCQEFIKQNGTQAVETQGKKEMLYLLSGLPKSKQ